MSRVFSVLALSASLAAAQLSDPITIPSSATDLMLQEENAQFMLEGFPDSDDTKGFGVTLAAQAIMTVSYAGTLLQGQGMQMTKDAVADQPTIYVTPSTASAANFSTSSTFTVMLTDASAVGHPDPEGNFRHFLANSLVAGSPVSGDNSTFVLSGGKTITNYAGPAPNTGEGPHRYAWLLFQQPSEFAAPANLSQSADPSHWSVSDYVTSSHLGSLVAASWFTVENGAASYTVGPTSSVNPATLPAGASGTGSGANPTSTGDSGSGAAKMVLGAAGTAIMGVAALVALVA